MSTLISHNNPYPIHMCSRYFIYDARYLPCLSFVDWRIIGGWPLAVYAYWITRTARRPHLPLSPNIIDPCCVHFPLSPIALCAYNLPNIIIECEIHFLLASRRQLNNNAAKTKKRVVSVRQNNRRSAISRAFIRNCVKYSNGISYIWTHLSGEAGRTIIGRGLCWSYWWSPIYWVTVLFVEFARK